MLGVLEIDRREHGPGFGSELAEEDIGNGDDDVQVLRARDVDEERQHRQDVDPVEDLVRRDRRRSLPAEAFKQAGERRGERPPGCRGIAALRDPGGVLAQHADHDGGDQAEDDEGIGFVAFVELAWPDDKPVDERHQHAHQDQDAEQVLQEGDPGGPTDRGQAEARDNAFPEGLDNRGQKDHESPENEETCRCRLRSAELHSRCAKFRRHDRSAARSTSTSPPPARTRWPGMWSNRFSLGPSRNIR